MTKEKISFWGYPLSWARQGRVCIYKTQAPFPHSEFSLEISPLISIISSARIYLFPQNPRKMSGGFFRVISHSHSTFIHTPRSNSLPHLTYTHTYAYLSVSNWVRSLFWAVFAVDFVFQGTSADQDTRFSNKQAKLMKSQKFAPELDNLVCFRFDLVNFCEFVWCLWLNLMWFVWIVCLCAGGYNESEDGCYEAMDC